MADSTDFDQTDMPGSAQSRSTIIAQFFSLLVCNSIKVIPNLEL